MGPSLGPVWYTYGQVGDIYRISANSLSCQGRVAAMASTTITDTKAFLPHRKESQYNGNSEFVNERNTIHPTRLLDLQAFNEDCSDIRLEETPVSGSPYTAPSHCWDSI